MKDIVNRKGSISSVVYWVNSRFGVNQSKKVKELEVAKRKFRKIQGIVVVV